MSPGWVSIIFLVLLLALVPFAVKWLQRRLAAGVSPGSVVASRVVSALAVGPHQHVVTVEVGAPEERVRLVLGVTAQSITCLHQSNLPTPAALALSKQSVAGAVGGGLT
ncbi:MAG: flagellar biosynthetic protein FliO [Rhodoferax sp.]|nr:flagellar biosynthetic protein FliO [Rhodoferax sp.]